MVVIDIPVLTALTSAILVLVGMSVGFALVSLHHYRRQLTTALKYMLPTRALQRKIKRGIMFSWIAEQAEKQGKTLLPEDFEKFNTHHKKWKMCPMCEGSGEVRR